MFGDVGGLNDFLVLLLAPVFGLISENFKSTALVSSLFHAAVPTVANDTVLNVLH